MNNFRLRLSLFFVSLFTACHSSKSSLEKPIVTSPTTLAKEEGLTMEAFADRFLDGYFSHRPVTATLLGDHRFDGQWPDLSTAGEQRFAAWQNEMMQQINIQAKHPLSPQETVDLELIRNEVLLLQFAQQTERSIHTNPLFYTSLIGSGLDELIRRDFAPLETRVTNLAMRLEGLPSLIEQALTNLSTANKVLVPHTQVALTQVEGIQLLIREEIPKHTPGISESLKQRMEHASGPALQALQKFETALKEQILANAQGKWRLGKDAFSRKLALTLQASIPAEELHQLALAEHANVRAQMASLAQELAPVLFVEQRRKSQDQQDSTDDITRRVLIELAKNRPQAKDLRDACAENLSRLQAFVEEQKLVPIDEREHLEVIWTPPHERGVAIAGLASPGPLEPGAPGLASFYLVQPVPEDWSPEQQESFLREYNYFMLEILSIHEAIPGHFVQLYQGKKAPSKIRRAFQNGAFVEGWAVYSEALMVEAGYAGAAPQTKPSHVSAGLWRVMSDPQLRAKAIALHRLKFYLRTVTNAILDYEIHAGTMTEAQAIELMTQRSFQEQGEAKAKWVRAQVSSTQLSTYFVGATEWFRLRKQAKEQATKQRRPLNLYNFHEAALSHGAPPVARLPRLMGWDN